MNVRIIQQLMGIQAFKCSLKKLSNNQVKTSSNPLVFIRQIQSNDQCRESTKLDKSSVANVANYWCEQFENEGIDEPRLSINYIIAHVLGTKKLSTLTNINEKKLSAEQLEQLDLLCKCKLSRMPLQYIVGDWDFRDITLKLEPPIFIPRPETEMLVEHLLQKINKSKNDKSKVLEIGCGSGAICLSLLKANKDIDLIAIDINPHACELTIRNAKEMQLDDCLKILNAKITDDGNIELIKKHPPTEAIDLNKEKFDYIISNPPYIPTKAVFKLQPEIRLYEDIKALDGGVDGLQLIKPIIKYASQALNSNGSLILEVDTSHPKLIQSIIEEKYASKLKVDEIHKDFSNNDRFVEIVKIE